MALCSQLISHLFDGLGGLEREVTCSLHGICFWGRFNDTQQQKHTNEDIRIEMYLKMIDKRSFILSLARVALN